MEAVVVPYKQGNASSRSGSSSRPTVNFASSNIHGGFSFYPPAYLSFTSLSPFHNQQIAGQPPLLPLPFQRHSLPSRTRDFSSSPPKPPRKVSKSRDKSLTPKKSKSPMKNKDPKLYLTSSTSSASDQHINLSTACLRRDRTELEMNLSRVLSQPSSPLSFIGKEEFVKFPGLMFTISPHPSSLPLPKFTISSKLKCNVEVGGINDGATDNLRRLLRLR